MTFPAGNRNIDMSYRRFGVVGSENLMRVAVAILARRRSCAGLSEPGMRALRVVSLRVRVAVRAGDFFRRGLVDEALHVLVAIHAAKHGAVDGALQLLSVNEEAHLVAICFGGQRLIGMAGETVFVFRLMFGACCEDPAKQNNQNRQQDSAGTFHAYEETLSPEIPP